MNCASPAFNKKVNHATSTKRRPPTAAQTKNCERSTGNYESTTPTKTARARREPKQKSTARDQQGIHPVTIAQTKNELRNPNRRLRKSKANKKLRKPDAKEKSELRELKKAFSLPSLKKTTCEPNKNVRAPCVKKINGASSMQLLNFPAAARTKK
jgi:hypothetical protein